MNLSAWPSIIDHLSAFLQSFQSPIVLCHNDLQEGNILFDESVHNQPALHQHSVQLIDFEYANFSHRGLDLGNHFCEWAIDNNCPAEPTGIVYSFFYTCFSVLIVRLV
jgi:thiamine kinase-like enzyme